CTGVVRDVAIWRNHARGRTTGLAGACGTVPDQHLGTRTGDFAPAPAPGGAQRVLRRASTVLENLTGIPCRARTDSARGPETAGNNRHVSDNADTGWSPTP